MSLVSPIRFRGLVAAPFTPFQNDHSLNLEVIPSYARFLEDNKVTAAFICGTTGEGLSLTVEERIKVAEAWTCAVSPRLKVIVHVGHLSLGDARALASHADRIGAAAISALAPCFFRPAEVSDLVDWCAAVASAAPRTPFYFYHIPSMTGVNFSIAKFLAEAGARIPTLVGIKYTHEDLADYSACVASAHGRYDILFGRDELLLEGWTEGARGAVGSTYNYAAPLYHRIIAALEKGDRTTARHWQDRSINMIAKCNSVGVTHLAASKTLMRTLGVDCGPVRPPLRQPNAEQIAALRVALESIGFFEFSSQSPAAVAV